MALGQEMACLILPPSYFIPNENVEVCEHLWHYTLARSSINLLGIYLAHLILRQVDWSLRYHDQTTSERYIRRGYMLLQEIEHRPRSILSTLNLLGKGLLTSASYLKYDAVEGPIIPH